jgi:hypothetical protein
LIYYRNQQTEHESPGPYPLTSRNVRCFLVGLACAAAVLLWQFITVHYNYQGRWNALFCTGEQNPQPPDLESERLYLFPLSQGYDGQMYHYVAHDPFFTRGFDAYVDAPRVRYRRILVPLAAHALAMGRDELVDRAYIGVVLFAIFCGGYWLSLYASMLGFSTALGFGFLLVPATLISMDRMTVDAALAALCVACGLLFAKQSRWRLYCLLVLAPLIRETGLLLIVGYAVSQMFARKSRMAVVFSTAAIPALVWYVFVGLHTDYTNTPGFSWIPLRGFGERLVHPYQYPFGALIAGASTILDYVALAGIALAIALACRMAWRRMSGPAETCIYAFTLLALFLDSPGAWTEAYAFGRTLSPLLLLLALHGLANRSWMSGLPLAMVTPRVLIQMAPQVFGVLRRGR